MSSAELIQEVNQEIGFLGEDDYKTKLDYENTINQENYSSTECCIYEM